jgi:DNA mismatch endonuclease (patch repair protein)
MRSHDRKEGRRPSKIASKPGEGPSVPKDRSPEPRKFTRPSLETSRRMACVRRAGTAPEMRVRKVLAGLGVRYRLNNHDLPGSPDLANRSRRWAVFVHGCFWHRHQGCSRASHPTRNSLYWTQKFRRNVQRDKDAVRMLKKLGWKVFVIWECDAEKRARTVAKMLGRQRQRDNHDRT